MGKMDCVSGPPRKASPAPSVLLNLHSPSPAKGASSPAQGAWGLMGTLSRKSHSCHGCTPCDPSHARVYSRWQRSNRRVSSPTYFPPLVSFQKLKQRALTLGTERLEPGALSRGDGTVSQPQACAPMWPRPQLSSLPEQGGENPGEK